MSAKIDHTASADFLRAAIRDAGPSAQLCKDEKTVPATPRSTIESSDITLNTTAPQPSKAPETKLNAGPSNKKKGESGNNNAVKKAEDTQEAELQAEDKVTTDIRKLVSVRKIDAIEGFDTINNLVQIEGWKVRAPKSKNFKKDELVIFLEVDTFLPAGGEFSSAFAEVGTSTIFEGEEGYRVTTHQYISFVSKKTIISQGHVYKLTQFPKIRADVQRREQDFAGGREAFVKTIREIDYTTMLGPRVRKWEEYPSYAGITQAARKFPQFIQKTKVERVQNCPNLFIKRKYKKQIFQESVKMDGSSMTIYFVHKDSRYYSHLPPLQPNEPGLEYILLSNGRFGVCSKNCDLSYDPACPYWRAALQHKYHTKLSEYGKTIAVQGELVGDKIEGNMSNYPPGLVEFWMYSVYEIHGSVRWDPRVVEKWAAEQFLRHVPVTAYGTVHDFARKHDDFLLRADVASIGDEGFVYKNCTDGRWFKVHSRNYLLEKEMILRGEEEEDDDDEIPGYDLDDEEADAWIDAYHNGELDDNPGVQAFLAWWEEAWGCPAPGKIKDKASVQTQAESQPTVVIQEQKASQPKKTEPANATTKQTDNMVQPAKKPMQDVISWLAQGSNEAEKWKELGYL